MERDYDGKRRAKENQRKVRDGAEEKIHHKESGAEQREPIPEGAGAELEIL